MDYSLPDIPNKEDVSENIEVCRKSVCFSVSNLYFLYRVKTKKSAQLKLLQFYIDELSRDYVVTEDDLSDITCNLISRIYVRISLFFHELTIN